MTDREITTVTRGEPWIGMMRSLVAGSAGLGANYRRVAGVLVHIGDSNTNGRPGYRLAYESEWLTPGGLFDGWTSYNLGQNGSTLEGWATTEITNVANPTYSDLPPDDYDTTDPGAGRLARAVNANPDVIMVSLGTNDLNTPNNRASIGTEANLRINLALLVNFLLDNTHASILLRMPQPFAHEDFGGITEWDDADEAAEASRRLRVVYREWIGTTDRVEVYDSHAALFGDRCDDKGVDCQDPWGAGNLIDDSLHPNNLGYRRAVQQISMMLLPHAQRTPVLGLLPSDISKFSKWSATLQHREAALSSGTSTTVAFEFPLVAALVDESGAVGPTALTAENAYPFQRNRALQDAQITGRTSLWQELLNAPIKSLIYAYSHASGVTIQLTALSLSQYVAASGSVPQYVIFNIAAADLTGFGGGPVTFYVTDERAIPFRPRQSFAIPMAALTVFAGPPFLPFTIGGAVCYRAPAASTPVITLYLVNQPDGRYVTGEETIAAPGKVIGTVTFVSNESRALLVFNGTNYPGGSLTLTATNEIIRAVITTGAVSDFGALADLKLTEY